jgi:MHS family shikimate/dehydroshikimate transporter-like MFS transporter
VRYSGASIGYQLASVFAGGLAFPISEYLIANYGWQSIAIYMALMALITVISVLLASETYRDDITATGDRERQLLVE